MVSVGQVLGPNSSPADIQQLGVNITARLSSQLLSNPIHGAFLDSCVHHCGKWGAITIDKATSPIAFQAWYDKATSTRFWNQAAEYPCDTCC